MLRAAFLLAFFYVSNSTRTIFCVLETKHDIIMLHKKESVLRRTEKRWGKFHGQKKRTRNTRLVQLERCGKVTYIMVKIKRRKAQKKLSAENVSNGTNSVAAELVNNNSAHATPHMSEMRKEQHTNINGWELNTSTENEPTLIQEQNVVEIVPNLEWLKSLTPDEKAACVQDLWTEMEKLSNTPEETTSVQLISKFEKWKTVAQQKPDIVEVEVNTIDDKTDGKGKPSPFPTLTVPKVSETLEGLSQTVDNIQEQLTNKATSAWKNFFTALPVDNPFFKAVEASPEGFGFFTKNQTFIPVRAVHASEDALLVKKFLENLSEQSKYLRFHQPMPVVRPAVANHLADRDGYERVALIALNPHPEGNEEEEIIAMAEYVLDETPEVAIVVADEWQGKGVGTQILKLLATLSLASGHKVWTAEVLNSNTGVMKLLKTVGKVKRVGSSGGSSTLHIHLQTGKIFNA